MEHSQFNRMEYAALYAFELLEKPMLGDFEGHLRVCEECVQEVAYWNRGTEAIETMRRFFAQRCTRRYWRRVSLLLALTFLTGAFVGAGVSLLYVPLPLR